MLFGLPCRVKQVPYEKYPVWKQAPKPVPSSKDHRLPTNVAKPLLALGATFWATIYGGIPAAVIFALWVDCTRHLPQRGAFRCGLHHAVCCNRCPANLQGTSVSEIDPMVNLQRVPNWSFCSCVECADANRPRFEIPLYLILVLLQERAEYTSVYQGQFTALLEFRIDPRGLFLRSNPYSSHC